jgi:UDP-N-acetylglucosamine 2-epimerase (non-hydrolysing)
MKKVFFVFGTRPEAIKMAPVIKLFQDNAFFEVKVCVTGQHREMLKQVLDVFEITPDFDLELMSANQSLATFTSLAVEKLDRLVSSQKPDLILAQGDTTSVFCTALVAFYNKVPLGHIEAGLRTGNLLSPWPEEANRVLTSHLTTLHFAPTDLAKQNLIKAQIPEKFIFKTGNTVVDAFLQAYKITKNRKTEIEELPDFLQPNNSSSDKKMILLTSHRRENFGKGLENIFYAVSKLANKFPDIHFVYPVHLNPNVQEPAYRILGKDISNIHLIKPQSYLKFVALLARSYLILTDSGGVQEEAPSIGKPVLVMRDTTERPEGVHAGTSRLVGTNKETIINHVSQLLTNTNKYNEMSHAVNPYGDGKASERIHNACKCYFEL